MNVSQFTAEQRKIFSYSDGTKTLFADPMEVCQKLQGCFAGKADQVLSDYFSDTKSLQVFDQVKQAVHYVFGFQEFDPATGQGTLFEVWHGALEAYLDFFQKLDESTAPTRTEVPPTEQPLTSPMDSLQETGLGFGRVSTGTG